jgi:hypothetical protein
MTLNASGNFCVGDTNAISRVDVVANTPAYLYSAGQLNVRTNEAQGANKGAMISLSGLSNAGSTVYNFGVIGAYKENGTSADYRSYMIFGTSDVYSNVIERMRISSDGFVGIYNNNPAYRLTVGGSSNDANNVLTGSQIVVGTTLGIRERGNTAGISGSVYATQIYQGNSGGGNLEIYNVSSAYSLVFGTQTTERMRISAAGYVGIGTNNPTKPLDVFNGDSAGDNVAARFRTNFNSTNALGVSIEFGDVSPTIFGKIMCSNQSTGTQRALTFSTYTSGGSLTEKMRIEGNGDLLLGTSFTSTYAGCTGKLNVLSSSGSTATPTIAVLNPDATAAFVAFSDTATVFGSITRAASAVLYNTTSDQRLKENIQNSDSASSLIDLLQVRQFDWKADGNHQRYGFVAQELVTVAPEAVYQPSDADAMMAVDYSKLVPMLVKEIQSLRARVLQLETN